MLQVFSACDIHFVFLPAQKAVEMLVLVGITFDFGLMSPKALRLKIHVSSFLDIAKNVCCHFRSFLFSVVFGVWSLCT